MVEYDQKIAGHTLAALASRALLEVGYRPDAPAEQRPDLRGPLCLAFGIKKFNDNSELIAFEDDVGKKYFLDALRKALKETVVALERMPTQAEIVQRVILPAIADPNVKKRRFEHGFLRPSMITAELAKAFTYQPGTGILRAPGAARKAVAQAKLEASADFHRALRQAKFLPPDAQPKACLEAIANAYSRVLTERVRQGVKGNFDQAGFEGQLRQQLNLLKVGLLSACATNPPAEASAYEITYGKGDKQQTIPVTKDDYNLFQAMEKMGVTFGRDLGGSEHLIPHQAEIKAGTHQLAFTEAGELHATPVAPRAAPPTPRGN